MGQRPIDESVADRVIQFAVSRMPDLRVYLLFAFQVGYGMLSLYMRQTEAGASESAVRASPKPSSDARCTYSPSPNHVATCKVQAPDLTHRR
ncbi:hypothetical protein GCM10009799_52230 [Nocardiopsis rhodophaea]|uniref:Uncharacterized protein n=1 Tax=Nocardiopsis rhodophaea TaxID=280238 RepID=A0ABP5F6D4_9ACTN